MIRILLSHHHFTIESPQILSRQKPFNPQSSIPIGSPQNPQSRWTLILNSWSAAEPITTNRSREVFLLESVCQLKVTVCWFEDERELGESISPSFGHYFAKSTIDIGFGLWLKFMLFGIQFGLCESVIFSVFYSMVGMILVWVSFFWLFFEI